MAEQIKGEISVHGLEVSLAAVLYENQMNALVQTLKEFRVSDRAYAILDDRDESVCLTCEEGKWRVYTSERGVKSDLSTFNDVEEACKMLLYRMSEDEDEYKQMIAYYNNKKKEISNNHFSSADIYKAIKEGINKLRKSVAVF